MWRADIPARIPTDTKFFQRKPTKRARFCAFGMTKRPGRSAANDPGVAGLLSADADAIVFVAKSWDYHVHVALGCTLEENLACIADSVTAAVAAGREAMVDCEHFFDGYKANPAYALECARTALDAGARWAVLCDTNGGTLPHEVERIVSEVAKATARRQARHPRPQRHRQCRREFAGRHSRRRAPGSGHAQRTRRTLRQRQSRIADPDARAQSGLCGALRNRRRCERLCARLSRISRTLDELLNEAPDRHAPYVGASAFATKAGIHASALAKDPRTYEHVPPESVGNQRARFSSPIRRAAPICSRSCSAWTSTSPRDDPRLSRILDEVKAREAQGYAYEAADASFELLARRLLGGLPDFFDVESFNVSVERKFNAAGARYSASLAVVKIRIGEETLISAAEGNGPVNALDLALRKDLGVYQKLIQDLELLDYRVRVFQGGTDAVTRVLIEFGDPGRPAPGRRSASPAT